MPQREKITKKLDLNNTAEIAGLRVVPATLNVAPPNNASGSTYIISNTNGRMYVFLPPVNGFKGRILNFIVANVVNCEFQSDALSNTIKSDLSVNAAHGITKVYAANTPSWFTFMGDGAWYYMVSPNILNVRSFHEG